MRYFFRDLVKAISVDAENQRLQKVTFAPAAPASETPASSAAKSVDEHAALAHSPKHAGQGTEPSASQAGASAGSSDAPAAPPSELDQNILAAQHQLAAGHPEAAQAMFENILTAHPHEPRVEFELAMVALKQQDADRAQMLLRRIVRHSPTGDGIQPDPKTLAWSHVYLGRIYDLQENRDDAVAEYSAALKVEGAPDAARKAAQAGQQSPYDASGGSSQQTPSGNPRQ